jgi:Uma2 family endonuclease
MPDRTNKLKLLREDEYLCLEEQAAIKHEYVDGNIFAMSGSSEAHNLITVNIISLLHLHLHGTPCRVFSSDMKVRIESAKSYYYPDVMVSCEPYEAKSVFKSNPVLLVEVLSPSTAPIDKREKMIAYTKIESLKEYVIVHQDRQRVEIYRRQSDGWELITVNSGQQLKLESVPKGPLAVPLSTIYEGCSPPSRVKEETGFYDLEPIDV